MKILILLFLSTSLAFGQPISQGIHHDTLSVHSSLFIEAPLLPGKPLRESGQFLAIGFAFAAVGVSSIIVGDAIRNPMVEVFGDVLTISSLPFVCVGINRLFEAGRRQEIIESQYPIAVTPE